MPASWKPDGRQLALAFLSGLMLAGSFPKWEQLWLAWLAPGFLLTIAAGQTGRRAFLIGFIAGLGQCLVGLYWLLFIPVKLYAAASWIALSLYLSLFFGAWCSVCVRTKWRGYFLQPLFCAAAWVAMEMGFAHVLSGFPWLLLGASQYKFLPLIQLSAVTGIYGVSFLIVWTSTALATGYARGRAAKHPMRAMLKITTAPFIALVMVIFLGVMRLASPAVAGGELKIALVQPSIPQRLIWDQNERTNRLNKLLELSHAALAEQPDLLVWPEAAMPGGLARTRETQELITGLVRSNKVWMIFGGEDSGRRFTANGDEIIDTLNTAFFVNPAGDLVARYHKRHLVVFGEYMPAANWLPFLKRFRERGGGFARGGGPSWFQIQQPRARLSTLICFEDVFPHLAREYVDDDTDILVNLTNNGWFGESAAQWQHAASAVFRAVENGVPLVRCANNGLTCWIDAHGQIHELYFPGSQDIYQAGYKIARVPLRNSAAHGQRTIYNRYGDWFGWSCVMLTGIGLVCSCRAGQATGESKK